MKRTITLLALVLSLSMAVGCNDNKNTDGSTTEKNADPESAKADIYAIADKFHAAFKNKKIDELKMLIDDNGFFMGTDPGEVYSHQSFVDYLNKKLSNPAIGTINYKIDRREMIFEDNGEGVILVDQFTPDVFTQHIPWRMATHLVKKDNVWKFDFISFSLTPNNDVVPAINMAAYQGE